MMSFDAYKWEVQVFQMCFAPFLNALRPLDPNLKYCQFSRFFYFSFLDFDNSTIEISMIFHLWVPFFFKSIIIKLFHINYVAVSMHYLVPYSHFGVFPQFSIYRLVGEFSFVGILQNILRFPKCLIESMESQLSNALSNAFIALLVAEISSFQLQKVPQYPPLQSVFTYVFE